MNLKDIYKRKLKNSIRYDVKITVDGKQVFVGRYDSRQEAIQARDKALGGKTITCSGCGKETIQGGHTGTYCRTCCSARSKKAYMSTDFSFLTEGSITPQQLASMPWR